MINLNDRWCTGQGAFLPIVFFLLLLTACQAGESSIPKRPVNVPKNAVWGGGVDGGNWYNCKKLNKQWHYYCIIYNDFNGQIESTGTYVLRGSYWDKEGNRPVVQDLNSLTLKYDTFDGDAIFLLNSVSLFKVSNGSPEELKQELKGPGSN